MKEKKIIKKVSAKKLKTLRAGDGPILSIRYTTPKEAATGNGNNQGDDSLGDS